MYVDKEINTISKGYETKDLLHLGTENIYFSFYGGNRIPTDGEAIGFPLGLVLALENKTEIQKRFLDHTIQFFYLNSTNLILTISKSCHNHREVEINDFNIISRSYRNKKKMEKKALLIRQERTPLNAQRLSIPSKVLNSFILLRHSNC